MVERINVFRSVQNTNEKHAKSRRKITAAVVSTVIASNALASSDTWQGTADGLWANPTNWATNPAVVPGTGDTATFGPTTGVSAIDLGGGVTINSILFTNASAYTFGSGTVSSQTLTLDNAGGVTVAAGNSNAEIFNAAVVLGNDGSAQTFNILNNGTGLLTFAGALSGSTGTGLKTLAINGTGDTAVSGVISDGTGGTTGINKTGVGVLTLSGTNTFTGGTVITGGTVAISGNLNLGAAGNAVSIDGGTLRTTNTAALTNTHAITIGAGGATLDILGTATSGQNSRVISGANTLLGSGTLRVNGRGNLDAAGGSGTLVINGANTGFTGNVSLNNGALVEYSNNSATGSGSAITLGNNSGLSVVNNITLSAPITVTGTGNVISFNNGNAGVIAGNVTLNNDVTFGLRDWYNYATVRSGTVSGVISGSHGISINSGTTLGAGGTLTMSGTNSYTGDTQVNAGALAFSGTGSSANSAIVLAPSSGAVPVAALRLLPSLTSGTVTRAASLTVYGTNGSGNNYHNVLITPVAANTNDQFTGALDLKSGGAFIGQSAASSGGNTVITFGSVTRNPGTVLSLRSLAGGFGGTPGATSTNLYFTSAPALVGSGGAAGTTSVSVLPWAFTGGIATYDATNGVRGLSASEQATLNSGMAAGQNAKVSANTTISTDTSVNSLFGTAGTISFGSDSTRLSVTSGAIVASTNYTIGSGTVGGNGILDFGTAEGFLHVDNARNLTVNSAIAGSGGLTVDLNDVNGTTTFVNLAGTNTYTGTTTFIGNNAAMTVRLTNSLALQNTTLDYNNYGASVTFGNGTTTGQTAYTFGGLKGAQNINLNNNNTAVQPVTLSLGNNNESTTYSGILSSTLSGGAITKIGTGTLTLTGANTYDGATTVKAGTLRATSAAYATVLNTANGGLDVQGGKFVFDYTGTTSPISTIKSVIDAGFNGDYASSFLAGRIRSTNRATAPSDLTLGFADDGVGKITVMITLPGDATLDGTVDFNDFLVLQNNFSNPNTTFGQGNFDYDGLTDFNDFLVLQNHFGQTTTGVPAGVTAAEYAQVMSITAADQVPEPAGLAVLGVVANGLLLRRKRLN